MIVRFLVEIPDGMDEHVLTTRLESEGARVRETTPCPLSRPDTPRLTEAELAVLRTLRACDTNRDIAATLHVSISTVKTHLKSIYKKLGVRTRAAAAITAMLCGLDAER